jgi:predicted acylesterase/phospholipase RssA
MIEHLVLSSAGPNGIIQLGMVAQVIESNIIDMNTITSIHASSAGSIIGVLLCLQIPIQEVVDYIIDRPLDKWFKIDISQFMMNKGIVSSTCFYDLLLPFFHAYDIPSTITMKELYERTTIDFHIFTTAVTPMKSIDLNHTTFPDLPVIQAVCMSSCIPMLFTPIQYKNEYYIDGGLLNHCPIPSCNEDTTLVILIDYKPELDLTSSFDFIQHILIKSFDIISSNDTIVDGKNIYRFNAKQLALHPSFWQQILTDKQFRKELIAMGKQHVMDIKLSE